MIPFLRVAGAALTGLSITMATASIAAADSKAECIQAAEDAQSLRGDGHLLAARQKLAVCSQDTCPAIVRDDCAKWSVEVLGLTPSIVVRALDSTGIDLAGVRVSVDNDLVPTGPEGVEIELDPGSHLLRFEHQEHVPVEQRVVVREAERHRTIAVQFGRTATGPASPPSPRAAARDVSSTSSVPAAGDSRVVPIALLGSGAAAGVVAIALWEWGLSERADMESGCAATHSCAQPEIDGARGKLVAGDVVATAGAGATALGVGLLLFGRHHSSPIGLGLRPTLSGATVGISGRF